VTRTINGQKLRCNGIKETLGETRAHNLSRYHKMMDRRCKSSSLLVHVEGYCFYNYLQSRENSYGVLSLIIKGSTSKHLQQTAPLYFNRPSQW